MNYISLIGDIVNSRGIKSRDTFQKKLDSELKKINKENPNLLSPYTLTLGDEFQAVYGKADNLFIDIWKLMIGLHPQKVRFALGVGTLTTPVNPKRAIGMDGPAFHYARSGISELKKTPYLMKIEGQNIKHLSLMNNTLFLISQVSGGWGLNRFQVLNGLLQGWASNKIASSLGISAVAVYKNIKAGSLDLIIDLQKEISNVLNEVLR